MDRRRMLQWLASAPTAALSTRLIAAPAVPGRLLLVFLRGGYDASSLLVPVASPFYYEARPAIAIKPPGEDPLAALPLDSAWGLHPALKTSLYPLWQQGQMAFVPFADTHDLTRSHFETQDAIELGQDGVTERDFGSGFLNRLAQVLNDTAETIAFTDQLPLVMRGSQVIANQAMRNLVRGGLDVRESRLIASMYQGNPLAERVNDGFRVRQEAQQQLSDEAVEAMRAGEVQAGVMQAANRNAINAQRFEQEARRVARMMRERYRIGFIDVGGWDTHVGQGAGSGYLASRFDELGRGLAAFAAESGPVWRDTVVVVISEFGRTFRENGNRGTDHGHGSVYWLLGGALRGGRVLGRQVRLEPATLFQNRDYPVLNEYRALLAGLLARMYGLDGDRLQTVFPGVTATDLGVI